MRRGLITSRTPREWNARVLTEDHFHDYCREEGILFHDDFQLDQPGGYMIHNDQPLIVVDRRLRGPRRLFVIWHEMAHYWLHVPPIHHFHQTYSIAEEEADVVAICAMIPREKLVHYRPDELVGEYGYKFDQVAFRREVFDRYKI